MILDRFKGVIKIITAKVFYSFSNPFSRPILYNMSLVTEVWL